MKHYRLAIYLTSASAIALCSALFLSSCAVQQFETKVVKDFAIQETLQGTRVDLERPEYLANIVEMAGDYYVFNAIRASYCFQVYDKNFQLVDTLVRKGGGPGELSGQELYLGQWSGRNSSPNLLVYSSAQRKLLEIPLKSPQTIATIADLSHVENIYPKFVYRTKDGMLYGMNLAVNNEGGLFSYNPSTQEVDMSQAAFEFAPDLSPFYATQQTMAINTESRRLYTAYLNYPCVAEYDTDLNIVGRYNIEERVNTTALTNDSHCPDLVNIRCHNGKLIVLYSPYGNQEHLLKLIGADGKAIASYAVGNAIWYLIDEPNNRLITVHYGTVKDVIYLMVYPLPKTFLKGMV